jgi:hypothetical protein
VVDVVTCDSGWPGAVIKVLVPKELPAEADASFLAVKGLRYLSLFVSTPHESDVPGAHR